MNKAQKEFLRQKVIGAFMGVAIGDALGMPVETWTAEDIARKHGLVTSYLDPTGLKWFDGRMPGEWTDDTLFTLLLAESLIDKGGIDLDDLAARHADLYKKGELKQYGAGGSTRKALRALADGAHWSKSGIEKAAGNGVAMKVAPLGMLLMSKVFHSIEAGSYEMEYGKICESVYWPAVQLALMTHRTGMAAASATAHVDATFQALGSNLAGQNVETMFLDAGTILDSCCMAEYNAPFGDGSANKMSARIKDMIAAKPHRRLATHELAVYYGGAGCYVYDSLPFCYAAFLRRPNNIRTLYEVASAGGDTDTNASIVGGLLGAYNGVEIFPQHLIDGLWQKDRIQAVALKFWQKFFAGL